MRKQTTDSLVIIEPSTFGFNISSSESNFFQLKPSLTDKEIYNKAFSEFNNLKELLIKKGINVISVDYGKEEFLPDAVFPNNWFATFDDGTIIYFPMKPENRRGERKPELLRNNLRNYVIKREIDLSKYENDGFYLEGTGSVVIDRINNMAYACKSPRTNRVMFDIFCSTVNIPVNSRFYFEAKDRKNRDIYHTNVILSIGDGFCIVCKDAIHGNQWDRLNKKLNETGLTIIEIDYYQMKKFCANVLHINDSAGRYYVLMSEKAFSTFTKKQVGQIEKFGEIIYSDINTIENTGGGSARCMVAEIFLPRKIISGD